MPEPTLVSGLTDPRGLALERVPIRTRELPVTLSAWRLSAEAAEGAGSIARVESGDTVFYRGDGIFLGWPQDRLAEIYAAIRPADDAPPFETQQLG